MIKKLLLVLALLLTPLVTQAQISGAGQLTCSGATVTGTVANSGTANNTPLATATNTPAYGILVQLDQTTTITGGAITFNVSGDGAANYIAAPIAQVLNPSTGAQLTNPYTLVASTNQSFLIVLAGYSNFQIKLTTALTGTGAVTPYMTPLCQPIGLVFLDASGNLKVNLNANSFGTVTVTGTVSVNALPTGSNTIGKVDVLGNAGAIFDQAPGSAVPANAVMEGLSDGTNTRFALSDASGRQIVKQYPDTTTTSYHASKNVASAASATDIAVMPGNATNTVLVNRVLVSCTQTTAGIITVQLIKRSTADTAGTSSAMTAVPDDANYAAGVSAPLTYTANPTTGTAIGNVDTISVGCLATATAGANDIYVFRPIKPIVLRGTAQQLAVNLNATTVTGGSFNVTFEYSETTTP